MRHSLQLIVLLSLLAALLSVVSGMPWGWGPASNGGPIGGPGWNGGPDQSTDNIILHQRSKWRL
ncbi:uncharacterized protein LOC108595894 [Drosophila busckii]|uniref:uncharacterized protein LOC108595894 n=1 Tax=Drosophila busckii TaxID=30019 RepID=UPI00083F4F6D|nr:uncharacterized protein LOC108595894 [Drosophila busckii]